MFVPSVSYLTGFRIVRPSVIRPDVPQTEKPKDAETVRREPQQPKRKRHV